MTNGFATEEIEQASVSALLQWPDQCFPVIEQFVITPKNFRSEPNRVLFEQAREQWQSGKPLELISFTNRLRELRLLDRIGGPSYLTHTWCSICHSPKVMDYYCEILTEENAKREAVRACHDAIKEAATPGMDAATLVPSTIGSLSSISLGPRHRKERSLSEAVAAKMDRIQRGEQTEDIILTGIAKLDQKSPLRRGDMPLIGGVKKSGKSVLALSILLNVARKGIAGAYFSLEDREPKVIDRLFAGISRIPLNETPNEDDSAQAIRQLSNLPIFIRDDKFGLSEIQAEVRELKARHGIGLAVVDYGQLVRTKERKDVSREQSVAEVSRTLRLLAMELDLPIIVLSQLNTEGYTRESRALENDTTAMWEIEEIEDEPNERWIRVPYQRNGPSGIAFKVTFLGEIARVENHQEA